MFTYVNTYTHDIEESTAIGINLKCFYSAAGSSYVVTVDLPRALFGVGS